MLSWWGLFDLFSSYFRIYGKVYSYLISGFDNSQINSFNVLILAILKDEGARY